jgi:hypothetical protein
MERREGENPKGKGKEIIEIHRGSQTKREDPTAGAEPKIQRRRSESLRIRDGCNQGRRTVTGKF